MLFHCHDLGRHLGCYGVSTVDTPNIDRFAAEGVIFRNSFCVAPQCSPSRAAMFTGRYPHSNGVMGLTHDGFGWEINSDETHLAQCLRSAGYHTAAFGIIHETRDPRRWGYQVVDQETVTAREVCDRMIRHLEQRAAERRTPFFVSVGCEEPHRMPGPGEHHYMGFLGDHVNPDSRHGVHIPRYLSDDEGTRAELAELQGAVTHLDAEFGRLLQALDRLELTSGTLVVFTTDHGVAMPRAKCSCYDPGLEIALVLRLPSRAGWNGGGAVSELISNVDITPTLFELAEAPAPQTVQGNSWAALLDGRSYTPREHIFAELTYHDYYDPMRAVRTHHYKLVAFFSEAPSFMSPTQSWKPRSSPAHPSEPPLAYHAPVELYDLQNDPAEQRNLASDPEYEEVRRALGKTLRSHLEDTADPILHGAVTPPAHHRAIDFLFER